MFNHGYLGALLALVIVCGTLLGGVYLATGRWRVAVVTQDSAAFVVDRFTGRTKLCFSGGCEMLEDGTGLIDLGGDEDAPAGEPKQTGL